MIGRDHPPEKIRHMIVFLEEVDGTQHGYEVFDGSCSWMLQGAGPSRVGFGSYGSVTITGRIHRRNTSGLEMFPNREVLERTQREIGP